MKRSSHQPRRKVWLAMFIFLALSILLLATYPNVLTAQGIAQSRQPEIREEKITRAVLQITNRCPQPHRFRIDSDIKDPTFKQQTNAVLIGASSTEKIEALFDEMGLERNLKAVAECLDCKTQEGCAQDRYEVPIKMTPVNTVLRSAPPVSTRWSSSTSTQAGAYDVGIIPETSSGCPVGSEYVIISMDDQDDDLIFGTHNISSVSGWTGVISRYSTGTTFGFCRVDGSNFHQFVGGNYVVLQLGSSCPAGSTRFSRVFDNENDSPHNWSSGNIGPNLQGGTDTKLYFCFFPAAQIMFSFPNFHVPYGVFAQPNSASFASGKVDTDDEDDNPQLDQTTAITNNWYTTLFTFIIYGTDNPTTGRNSELLVTKVANDTCNVNPCPYIGSYDGANCWVGQPPKKTAAFIWSTNFYYTPVNGALSAPQKCPKLGSWYDGANCFMKAIPPQTTPFIWSNMWYVAPVCRP